MFSMPGAGELVIIFAVVLLLFGAKKLPALGGAIGESIRNFKKGIRQGEEDEKDRDYEEKNGGRENSSR